MTNGKRAWCPVVLEHLGLSLPINCCGFNKHSSVSHIWHFLPRHSCYHFILHVAWIWSYSDFTVNSIRSTLIASRPSVSLHFTDNILTFVSYTTVFIVCTPMSIPLCVLMDIVGIPISPCVPQPLSRAAPPDAVARQLFSSVLPVFCQKAQFPHTELCALLILKTWQFYVGLVK